MPARNEKELEEKVSDNIHLAMADKKKPDQSNERVNVFAVGDRINELTVQGYRWISGRMRQL